MDHRGLIQLWITVVHVKDHMQGNKQRIPSPVRIPDDLKLWLKHKAVDNHRSLNSEIIFRLEQSRQAEEATLSQGAAA